MIGLWPCGGVDGDGTCAEQDVTEVLGNVVYNGPFNPQYHSEAPTGAPPHQNFSVAVPDTFQSGQVSLGVAHLSLVGVSHNASSCEGLTSWMTQSWSHRRRSLPCTSSRTSH